MPNPAGITNSPSRLSHVSIHLSPSCSSCMRRCVTECKCVWSSCSLSTGGVLLLLAPLALHLRECVFVCVCVLISPPAGCSWFVICCFLVPLVVCWFCLCLSVCLSGAHSTSVLPPSAPSAGKPFSFSCCSRYLKLAALGCCLILVCAVLCAVHCAGMTTKQVALSPQKLAYAGSDV